LAKINRRHNYFCRHSLSGREFKFAIFLRLSSMVLDYVVFYTKPYSLERKHIMKNLTLPGNPRYQPKDLQPHFGYDNLYLAVAEVEISTMHVLAEIGVIPKADIALLTPDVEAALFAITTTEVDVVEREITKHDIRAWVQLAKSLVHPRLRRWIHIPLTSYDVLETARIIQFVRAHKDVVMSLTDKVIRDFIEKILAFSDQVQIGRTHGQHALPITIGFWLATILNRILVNINSANIAAANLVGKISGPVGAYNAQLGLGISLRCGSVSFERRVLGRLGLKPARIVRRSCNLSLCQTICLHASSFRRRSVNLAVMGGI